MLNKQISRRVFMGATMYVVTAPLFATLFKSNLELQKVMTDGQYFDAHALTVLTDVAEIMIPKTETPGATDAHVIPVLDGLMLTWASEQTKLQYKAIVQQISEIAQSTYQADYSTLPLAQRQLLIEQLDATAFANQHTGLSANYRKLKEMIFHIFYTSEEANPNFVLIPGEYRGDLTKLELEQIQQRGYL